MTAFHIRVTDAGYQVYSTANGIDRHDIGPARRTPRGAMALCDSLAATGTGQDGPEPPGDAASGGPRSAEPIGGRLRPSERKTLRGGL